MIKMLSDSTFLYVKFGEMFMCANMTNEIGSQSLSSSNNAVDKSSSNLSTDSQHTTNLISGYTIMLEQYEKLKSDLTSICNYMNDGGISLNSALKAFSQSYSINGLSADSGKLESVIKDTNSVKTYLNNEVMMAINLEIDDLKKRIVQLQSQL